MKLKKYLLIALLAGVTTLAVVLITPIVSNFFFFRSLPDPPPTSASGLDYCRLCTFLPTNAPMALNLNNGEANELRLFQPHETICNAITEEDHYGYMQMSGGEIACWSFPDDRRADIDVQKKNVFNYSTESAKQYFCDNCFAAIDLVNPTSNYVFVDAYDKDNLAFYNLEKAKEGIDIRHYHLEWDDETNNTISIKMTSSYYDGGKSLDY